MEFLFLLPLLLLGFALDAVTTSEAPTDAADDSADTAAADTAADDGAEARGSLLDGGEDHAAKDDAQEEHDAEAAPQDPAPASQAAEVGESHEWGADTGPAMVHDFDPATDRVEIGLSAAAAAPQVQLVPWGGSGTLLVVNGEEAALFPNAAPADFGPETLLWRAG